MVEDGSPRVVRYAPPTSWFERYRQWWIFLVAAALAALSAALQRSWKPLYGVAVWIVVLAAVRTLVPRFRKDRDFVADQVRIRRPIRGADILWSHVECVVAAGRFDPVVQVRLVDGRLKPTGFPPEYAERLAEVGQRPMCDGSGRRRRSTS